MQVVFLDIDGVLNSTGFVEESPLSPDEDLWGPASIDPAAMVLLNELLQRSGAHVVISSTWRGKCSRDELQSIFVSRGFRGQIVDVTPTLHRTPDGYKPVRGDEIQAWLQEHQEVTTFVILDDDDDMGALHASLVRTDANVGLQRADVERALLRLGMHG